MKKKQVKVKESLRKNLLLSLGMLVFFGIAGIVQAAQPPHLPPRFQEVEGSKGSIVRDSTTGLEWQRCPHGQSWTGSGCSGKAWRGTWENAVRVTAPGGFRVPTIDELKTLAPYDQSIFPGYYWYWSSSPYANNPGRAWALYFGACVASNFLKYGNGEARLVRGGQ